MNQKDKNVEYKKEINKNYNNTSKQQKNALKEKIMNKYGVSSEEAKKILSIIEKKERNRINNKNYVQFDDSSNIPQTSKINKKSNENKFQHVLDDKDYINSNPRNLNQASSEIHNQKSKSKLEKKKTSNNNQNLNETLTIKNNESNSNAKKSFTSHQKIQKNHNTETNLKNQKPISIINKECSEKDKNVDSILEDIIPNYNQQISIKVNHVDLTFEVQNEKIDTLKEAFIRNFKRDKSNKIKIHALKDVSFQIYKGEKVGIIGYNGAGKSTLLNVITGIYPPDKGNVTTYGHISPLLSLGAGFDHNFSGRQNIMLNGAVLGYDKDFLESKIDEIIEFSELGKYIDIPIKNYSSGMLAKLGFSIATSVNPDILIIDEILGVGDVNFVKKSADKIRSLMDGNTTVILVSHSIPQIRELCDKAIWIYEGSVRAIGDVNKVCDEYLKDAEKATNDQLANIKLY